MADPGHVKVGVIIGRNPMAVIGEGDLATDDATAVGRSLAALLRETADSVDPDRQPRPRTTATRSPRRGAARRLGLRPPPAPLLLAHVRTPDGTVHRLAAVGSRGRAGYVDRRGSVVPGPSVTVTSGAITTTTVSRGAITKTRTRTRGAEL